MSTLTHRPLCRILYALLLCASANLLGATAEFQRASDDPEVVKRKLFPKKGKFELGLPDVGFIMNQSYLNTILLHGGASYYVSEDWGFGVDAAFAINKDKTERTCIENFFNNPEFDAPSECSPDPSTLNGTKANYGPAYVPIREIKYLIGANATWNPVYGKQLFLRSMTGYFDLFVNLGLGIAMSDFYPQQTKLANGRDSRSQDITKGGADPKQTELYGTAGRPTPESETTPTIILGLGQKYHYLKRFNFKLEMRNYTLIGTSSGFDNFFTLWGGVGVRLGG